MRVLVVEDERQLADSIAEGLRHHAIAVDIAYDGEAGLERASINDYDVVILDRDLPLLSGDEVCAALVRSKPETRILMLTAATALGQRVEGLGLGADDYLTKPFHTEELLARLRALLRRSQAATSAVLGFGPLEMDTAHRRVTLVGQPMELGPREWTVLEYLLMQVPKPAAKDKLLQVLTGWDKEITPNAIEVYVSRLRAKLEPAGICLRAIRGFGYRLELAEHPGHATTA